MLSDETFVRHGNFIEVLEPRVSDLLTSRLYRSITVSRAIREGGVRVLGARDGGALDPVEVALTIVSHALIARSLIVSMRDPGFWVRSRVSGVPNPVARPAFPMVHLTSILGAGERPLETALSSLSGDRAIEVVRAPNGTRAVLLLDGALDEGRFLSFLRV